MSETDDELVTSIIGLAIQLTRMLDHAAFVKDGYVRVRDPNYLIDRLTGAATRIASLTARVSELEQALATGRLNSSERRATDPALGWDGIGEIFDPNCHCEKCAIGRAQQRERNDARSLIPKP